MTHTKIKSHVRKINNKRVIVKKHRRRVLPKTPQFYRSATNIINLNREENRALHREMMNLQRQLDQTQSINKSQLLEEQISARKRRIRENQSKVDSINHRFFKGNPK